MVVTPRILAVLCAVTLVVAGESANPLDQAEVILRIRDGAWVDREATRFAAAYGSDLASVRAELARVLFRSRGFEGIDLSRPALVAWRSGNAPLLVAIPVSNRNEFLASFGAIDSTEAPLVRTGERDGTVIYKQNQPAGEWEYRLLVAGNVAYLARTTDECRRLATALAVPVTDPSAAPVELMLRGQGIRSPRLPGADWLDDLPASPIDGAELTLVPGLLSRGWDGIADQVSYISITARTNTAGSLILNARLNARPDSVLAGWITAQRPDTGRIAGQLKRPDTAVLICGQLTFQGQLERWGFDQAELLRTAGGRNWTESADGAFRGLCTLAERTGAFALAVERTSKGLLQHWVVEHPRALEVAQSAAQVASALRGSEMTSLNVSGRPAMGMTTPTVATVCASSDRHAVRTDDHADKHPATAAGDLLQRLEQPGILTEQPSLATVWVDLALAWNAPPTAEGERAEPVVLTGALRPTGASGLDLSTSVPLGALGKLLGRLHKPATKND